MRTLIILLVLLIAASVSAQTTSYVLTWQANPEPVERYVIYRSLGLHGPYTAIDSVAGTLTTCVVPNLSLDTRHYFKLVAVDAAGARSDLSSQVSVSGLTVDALVAFCAITGIERVSASEYAITWSTPDPQTGFLVYDTDPDLDTSGPWDLQLVSEHTMILDGLTVPATYYIRAVAYDSESNMTASALASFETTADPDPPVTYIYPLFAAPYAGGMTFDGAPIGGEIFVYDTGGAVEWQSGEILVSTVYWDASGTAPGMYYVHVLNASAELVSSMPVVIQ